MYGISTTGMTIQMHYCMGKLVGESFFKKETKQCGKCGMDKNAKKDNGCCKDEYKRVKIPHEQKVSETIFQCMQSVAAVLPAAYVELSAVKISSITEENPTGNAPPAGIGIPIYKRNRVFRV